MTSEPNKPAQPRIELTEAERDAVIEAFRAASESLNKTRIAYLELANAIVDAQNAITDAYRAAFEEVGPVNPG